jgi:hypothetical protein
MAGILAAPPLIGFLCLERVWLVGRGNAGTGPEQFLNRQFATQISSRSSMSSCRNDALPPPVDAEPSSVAVAKTERYISMSSGQAWVNFQRCQETTFIQTW